MSVEERIDHYGSDREPLIHSEHERAECHKATLQWEWDVLQLFMMLEPGVNFGEGL